MLPLIGMAAGMIPAVSGLFTAAKQKRMAKDAAGQANVMNAQTLGWANKGLGTAQGMQSAAQNLYNGRMAGAGQAQANIFRNQAGALANMQRGATSSADLLAMAGATQGQADSSFQNLAAQEAQDKQQRFGEVQQAGMNVQNAQGNLQNYYGGQAQQAQQSANQLMNASMTNKANAWNQIANTGMTAAMGGFGDLGGPFRRGIPRSLQGVRNNSFSPLLYPTTSNSGILNSIAPNKISFGLIK